MTFAVQQEARPLQRHLAGSVTASILLTGIGPAHARQAVQDYLTHSTPSLVISSGFAGGLNPALSAGTLLCDTTHAPALTPLLRQLGLRVGTFHSAARVATTPREKADLYRETGADAVEMESGPITQVCQEHTLPCAVIRVVSDAADEALPLDFNRCLDAKGRLIWSPLLRQCVGHPSTIRGLLRLQRTSKRAAQHLADTLPAIINQWIKIPS